MEIKHFYVGYADYGGRPVHIQLLTEEQYHAWNEAQPDDPRLHRATIYSDSTREDDPLINTIVITEHKVLGQERAATIEQQVIDWLMDEGHMPKR